MIYTDYIDSIQYSGTTISYDPPMLVGVEIPEVHQTNRPEPDYGLTGGLMDITDDLIQLFRYCFGWSPGDVEEYMHIHGRDEI